MNEKRISFLYRLLLISSLYWGIVLNINHVSHTRMILSYYTLQINIFCLAIIFLFLVADILGINYREGELYYLIKGEMIISVTLMMVMYLVALMPRNFSMYSFHTKNELANILVHIVSPILVIVDYLLFDQKGKFKKVYPIAWITVPLYYVIYVYIYSANGGKFYNIGGSRKYAYMFLDFEENGYIMTAVFIGLIAISVILLGRLLIGLDKRLKLRD